MSGQIDDGGGAFPVGYHPEGNSADQPGMSLRDWFAGQALQGMMANPILLSADGEFRETNFAMCYQCADAMIAARKGGVE